MHALICGAGIAGLTLARCLHDLGWQVTVIDRAPGPRTTGYMMDFFGPGFDAVDALGLLPALREVGYRVEELAYRDGLGRVRARMRYDDFAKLVDGRLVSILRPDLEAVLRRALPPEVELHYSATIVQVRDSPARLEVTLDQGTMLTPDLLVGADGIHSVVRRLVFGPEHRFSRYLGLHTAAYLCTDSEIHAQVRGQFAVTDSIQRQVGCYGLRDGRVAVFTVHRSPDPELPADPRAAIRSAYAGLGWITGRVLDACPPADEIYYDQVAQVELPVWSRGRVVLIGDAAYAVSLLAGQGASLGIAGAYLLADQIGRGTSLTAALTGYERLLRPTIADRQAAARSGARWFLPATRTQLLLRRAILRTGGLPLVNRRLARLLAGREPAILSG